jgi:hypothetical protein
MDWKVKINLRPDGLHQVEVITDDPGHSTARTILPGITRENAKKEIEAAIKSGVDHHLRHRDNELAEARAMAQSDLVE